VAATEMGVAATAAVTIAVGTAAGMATHA